MKGAENPGPCHIEAPCKINLHLRVGARRPDGFHDLESLFVTLDYGDTLELEPAGAEGSCHIAMIWEGPGPMPPEIASLPPEKNLVYRAVSLFRKKTGFTGGLRGRLTKRIPPGSGYGGGSSDAAAALLALNRLAPGTLAPLPALAAELGSDVPFFLRKGAALVRGRGERVEPLPVPRNLTALLVKPPFPSGTGAAFARLEKRRESAPAPAGPQGALLKKSLTAPPAAWPFYNDFLPLFLETPGEGEYYREILRSLKELGADFAGLSGSGSGCFGIFTDEGTARKAEEVLSRSPALVQLVRRAALVA